MAIGFGGTLTMFGFSKAGRAWWIFTTLGVILLVGTGCGGGGGGVTGDRVGQNTLPVILDLQTPLGMQGTRGVGPDVTVVFHVRDREFDPTNVEVQFGYDQNRDGTIEDGEFQTASEGPGSEGTVNLGAAPGPGAGHIFVWDSLKDIGSARYVTQDYVYTQTGRVALDDFGEPVFQSFPGAVIRIRPVTNGVAGAWRYSDPFGVNNNNRPSVVVGSVEYPPEGQSDRTVNEQVVVDWTATDPDSDALTIAVDWASVPAGYDVGGHTLAELESLPWTPATAGGLGDGTYQLPASPTGIAHKFSWDSVKDAGTANQWVVLRFRPIDAKLEVGDWFYSSAPFHLDNYTIFTDPDASLPIPLAGARAVLLLDESIETVLVVGGTETQDGDGTNFAALFYPGRTQTTKGVIAAIPGGMNEARVGLTATRLLDGRVLVVGGAGAEGAVSDTAEMFDPATRKFTVLPSHLTTPRRDHVAVLLANGDVLVAGGRDGNHTVLSSAEVFHTETGTFAAIDASRSMGEARTGAAAVRLPDGRVLVAGGRGTNAPLSTVEIYDPMTDGFVVTDTGNDMSRPREGLTLTSTLEATYAAVAAGGMAGGPTTTLERFNWKDDSFSDAAPPMRVARAYHSAVLLGDGRILIAGGQVDEAGTLTSTADIYDPVSDSMDLPNGDMLTAVRDAGVAILQKGRPVIFGGLVSAAATKRIQVFTPDGGFNERPLAQIADMLGALEPWSFGVRFRWRAIDPEGDPVKIVCQFRIKPSANDDSASLPEALRDRWLAATMRDRTVLGEVSSGVTALSSRKDFVDTVDNPIDAPDVDPGEHLFVWNTEADIPKGDYDNVFFRILIYGAEEGTGVESARFSIAKNAPVIARIKAPLNTWGKLVVPFYLQDSDAGELAKAVWEYGVDINGDGKIVASDGEKWFPVRHSEVDADLGGVTYTDAGTLDLVSGSQDPDPNNDYTDPTGIPWGKQHFLVWDSVYDLGSPASPRKDVILRLTPYDYPAGDSANARLGIVSTVSGFTLEKDPGGLYLSKWYPVAAGTDPSGAYEYAGVKTDEPIRFEFTAPVDPASLAAPDGYSAIQVVKSGGGTVVTGYFAVDNSSGKGVVTFYPQVQEIPSRSDILLENTGYQVYVAGYDTTDRNHPIVKRLGADPEDTDKYFLLLGTDTPNAFKTGTGALPESVAPAVESRLTPSADSGVSTSSSVTMMFTDRLLPGSVGPTTFTLVAQAFGGVDSLVPGTFKLENIVDEGGPGGTLRKYAKLTLIPDMTLPPDSTKIEIQISTGLKDLAGNPLSASVASQFTTAAGTSTINGSQTESFDDTKNRDSNLTTAFWGTADPVSKGSAAGSGVAGKLTGLYDGGDGSDGALDLTGGDKTLTSSSSKSSWQYTTVDIPYGRTLTLEGTAPISIRVQGDVTINGTVNASGATGSVGFTYPTSGTTSGAKGGAGGPGGGAGGSVGSYTWKQTKPVSGTAGASGTGDSAGKGGGKAGSGAIYGSGNYTYWGGGGGGGAHASAGLKGQDGYTGYGLMGGAGGTAYGSANLSSGLEAGAGGGAGSAAVMAYTYSSWYGAGSGGGGGGGGGGLLFSSNSKITIGSSGKIVARGGDGGYAPYAYAWTSVYPGGGGGGAGGTIQLQGAEMDLTGSLEVLGGKGGTNQGSSYPGYGGDGGDGRLRFEKPNFSGKLFNGALYTSSSMITTGSGGSVDWKITGTVTVDTDSFSGVPSNLTVSKGKILVKDFILSGTLTLTGTKPFLVEASGNVEISGTILASGNPGQNGSTSYYGSSSGWIWQPAAGGKGVVGGFDGGSNAGTGSASSSIYAPKDGTGVDGKEGGTGGGKGGRAASTPYSYTSGSYTYYYYYYSGGGGGGGGGEAGGKGSNYLYSGKFGGTPGDGGAKAVDPSTLSPSNITGGAGGGGGANGGYSYYYPKSWYYIGYGPGAGGGGGSAGVSITADGTITLSGTIRLLGGDGGNCQQSSSSYYAMFPGPGGGGAGGNTFLQAAGGFTFGLVTIDASGGKGGVTQYSTSTVYSSGGDGGAGAITLRSKKGVSLPGDLPKSALYGQGTLSGGDYAPTKLGVSVWLDTGAVAPEFLSRVVVDNGGSKLYLQGAQTDLITGGADESKATAWIDVTGGDLSGLNGYRWFRFKSELQPMLKALPQVSSIQILWKYRR